MPKGFRSFPKLIERLITRAVDSHAAPVLANQRLAYIARVGKVLRVDSN